MVSLATKHAVIVRPARLLELPALAEIWRELMAMHAGRDERFALAPRAAERWEQLAADLVEREDGFVLAAEQERALVGFCVGWIARNPVIYRVAEVGFVSEIAVTRRARRGGVGRALMREVRRWFVNKGVTELQLSTAVWNAEARAFWEALGGEPMLLRYHFDLGHSDTM